MGMLSEISHLFVHKKSHFIFSSVNRAVTFSNQLIFKVDHGDKKITIQCILNSGAREWIYIYMPSLLRECLGVQVSGYSGGLGIRRSRVRYPTIRKTHRVHAVYIKAV